MLQHVSAQFTHLSEFSYLKHLKCQWILLYDISTITTSHAKLTNYSDQKQNSKTKQTKQTNKTNIQIKDACTFGQ